MDDQDTLVGELRSYLSSAQPTKTEEIEQVKALKRDLDLAARVGQQLLMQLRQAESQRDAAQLSLDELRRANAQIQRENQKLASEQALFQETLSTHEAYVETLLRQLNDAQLRAERLARATAAAKALQHEVEMLEEMHAELRTELDSSIAERNAAQSLARSLAEQLGRYVAKKFNLIKADTTKPEIINNAVKSAAPPAVTSTTVSDFVAVTPNVAAIASPITSPTMAAVTTAVIVPSTVSVVSESTPIPVKREVSPKRELSPIAEESFDSEPLSLSLASLTMNTTADTDVSLVTIADMELVDAATPKHTLRRARSLESVLSFVPSPPREVLQPHGLHPGGLQPLRAVGAKPEMGITPKTLTATASQTATATHARPARRSARVMLNQVRDRSERRWAFTSFRM